MEMSVPKIEICVDNLESVLTANQLKIDRIELCSALSLGGLSPSYGLLTEAIALSKVPLSVMIRPRSGDFIFSQQELKVMLTEVALCKSLSIQHIVIGALTPDAEIDLDCTKQLIDAAGEMEITFHRAFDLCRDPYLALEQLIELGCHRVLTSGQSINAFQGIPVLKQLVKQSDSRIQIIAGCGINAKNVGEILEKTKVPEIHFSAKGQRWSLMKSMSNVVMGSSSERDQYIDILDIDKASNILHKIGMQA